MRELIDRFAAANGGCRPERLLLYRLLGSSRAGAGGALQQEVEAVRQACKAISDEVGHRTAAAGDRLACLACSGGDVGHCCAARSAALACLALHAATLRATLHTRHPATSAPHPPDHPRPLLTPLTPRPLSHQSGQDYAPAITFVAVSKGHPTRLFPLPGDAANLDRLANVLPGSVVDKQVVGCHEHDFLLVSSASVQGTSRPGHFQVVADDIGFGADALQVRRGGRP